MSFFVRLNGPRAVDPSQSVQADPTFHIKPSKGPVIVSRAPQIRLGEWECGKVIALPFLVSQGPSVSQEPLLCGGKRAQMQAFLSFLHVQCSCKLYLAVSGKDGRYKSGPVLP